MEPQPEDQMKRNDRSERPIIEMRGIRKSFFGTEVLKGVDLSLRRGKVHGLVGHNGAGKSTLIKVLAGVHTDNEGEILLEGSRVAFASPGESIDAGIGVIYQEFALVPEFTAAENLLLGREPQVSRGIVNHRKLRSQAEEALRNYGFDVPVDRPVRELSVAHQQLTEIAKALSVNARVLVMDEPTARLAPAERARLFKVIHKLTQNGVAVVYISHFLEEVLAICDEVTVLRDGTVVDHRDAQDFTLESLSTEIVGETVGEELEALATEEAAAGPTTSGNTVLKLENFAPEKLEAIDLDLAEGEVIGLAGLVGSGRTEILEAIAGARPSTGAMTLRGKKVEPRSAADGVEIGIALVPEDRKNKGLVMDSGIADNIVLSALSSKLSKFGFIDFGARKEHYQRGMKRFRILAADPSGTARTLSGGNQQKVLLARAAGTDPSVLLLDQPTAGVDVGAKAEIYGHIRSIASSGATCIVASDEMEELLLISDRIAVIRNGTITSIRPASEFDEHTLLAEMSKTD